jgi:hypothetical protein
MQRLAKPLTAVRFRPQPPYFCLNGKSEKSSSDVNMTLIMLVDSYYHT